MAPSHPLPLSPSFQDDPERYISSLLEFTTSNDLFMTLCGGVHILDFFTQDPDVYQTLLPLEWREWFARDEVGVDAMVGFLCWDDESSRSRGRTTAGGEGDGGESESVRDQEFTFFSSPFSSPPPPESLREYVKAIQKHCLQRDFPPLPWISSSSSSSASSSSSILATPPPTKATPTMAPSTAVGMKPKKIHEVSNFAVYINRLCDSISSTQESFTITDIVDFGAGQNYLGRALASEPYNRRIIAVESRLGNIEGARGMDVSAKLVKKEKEGKGKGERVTLWNKKLLMHFQVEEMDSVGSAQDSILASTSTSNSTETTETLSKKDPNKGSVRYIEHRITDGDLSSITSTLPPSSNLLIISLHSCGNLIHHGLRSLLLNRSVRAVALVGCCYNLMTERLGPPSYKLPSLRPPSERVDRLSVAKDPHGFPMSSRLVSYSHKKGQGVRLNITARMMAVQAPSNWTAQDCEGFFTRHFFRALLQRIFVDRGLLPSSSSSPSSPAIIIGSLRKTSYSSFVAYVRGAAQKILRSHQNGDTIKASIDALTDAEIREYETRYSHRKKELSLVWSLMAFSAGVVESLIVVDRWLFLKEHSELVEDCWVESVFDYGLSPRNLVVVGVKRREGVGALV